MASGDVEEEENSFLKKDMCFDVWTLGREVCDGEENVLELLLLMYELKASLVVAEEEAKRRQAGEEVVGRGVSRDDDVTDDAIDRLLTVLRVCMRNGAAAAAEEPRRRLEVVKRRIRGARYLARYDGIYGPRGGMSFGGVCPFFYDIRWPAACLRSSEFGWKKLLDEEIRPTALIS